MEFLRSQEAVDIRFGPTVHTNRHIYKNQSYQYKAAWCIYFQLVSLLKVMSTMDVNVYILSL
jgi:hypothetical protein